MDGAGGGLALFCLTFLCVCCHGGGVEGRTLSAVRKGPWKHEIVEGLHPQAAVTANFTNHINKTGWSFLEIHTVKDAVPDHEMAYLAGAMEGRLTGELILMQWYNTLGNFCSPSSPPSGFCSKLQDFLHENLLFLNEQAAKKTSSYWYQVDLFIQQMSGLKDGYQSLGLAPLPDHAFLYLQLHGDLDSLESALQGRASPHLQGSGSCSALVKFLPGNEDLLIGHNTWTSYTNMLRIYKLYDLKYGTAMDNDTIIPGSRQSFSSYPGRLYSGDDWYLLSSGLLAMETTIGNYNTSLWQYVTPDCVLENIRVAVANRLATSGEEWTNIFGRYNSGTYNNEWMVVDYKLFTKGDEELRDGLLWVLEQLPGTIMASDQTDVLRSKSYWASYNIPYYRDIFEKSGFEQMVEQHGSWFTHDGSPRAKIFARNHTQVTNMETMIALMKYNNFQHDPLSKCNCTPPYSGENAISARSDLNPSNGTYPFSALGHRYHGGIDMKVTSSALFDALSCMATSGPTHDQQPVFQWSTSGFKTKPLGQPDKFDFEPVLVQWTDN